MPAALRRPQKKHLFEKAVQTHTKKPPVLDKGALGFLGFCTESLIPNP